MSFAYVPKSKRKTSQPASLFDKGKPSILSKNDKVVLIPQDFLQKVQNMNNFQVSLKNYIKRCFSQCNSDIEREHVSKALIDKISLLSSTGSVSINSKNWLVEPLVSTTELTPKKVISVPLKTHQAFTSTSFNQSSKPQSNFLIQPALTSQYGIQTATPPNIIQRRFDFPSDLSPNLSDTSNPNQNQALFNTSVTEEHQIPTKRPLLGLKNVTLSSNSFKNILQQNNINQSSKSKLIKLDNINQENPTQKENKKNKKGNQNQLPNQSEKQNEKQNINTKQTKKEKKKKNKKEKIQSPKLVNFSVSVLPKVTKAPSLDKLSDFINLDLDSYMVKNLNKNKEKVSVEESYCQPNSSFLEEPVEGISTALEKQYLRLTDQPRPEDVRPEPVLKQSLQFVLQKYRKTGDYVYIEGQLRSIRQDLMVQHIEDNFVVKVYETAAELAIENKDWPNLHQSQIQLEKLYALGLGIQYNIEKVTGNRILYMIGVGDSLGLYSFIPKLNPQIFNSEPVQFGLHIWKIVSSCNWIQYLEILKSTKVEIIQDERQRLMNIERRKLLEIKQDEVRYMALPIIVNGYKQLRLEDYRELLGFDDINETKVFLESTNVIIPSE